MLYSSASKNQYVQFLRLRGGRPPSDSIYMYLYFSWFCREVFKCVLSCRRLAGRSHGGVRMSRSSHGGGGRTLPAWTGPGLPAWQWGSVKCPHHTVRAKVLKLVVSVSRETTNRKLSGNYISIVPGSRMCWFSWFWRICRTNWDIWWGQVGLLDDL